MQEDLETFYTHGFVVDADHGMEVADCDDEDSALQADLASMNNNLNDDLRRRLAQFEAEDDVDDDYQL